MQTLRLGLIGYGAWGKFHARAIQETPGCELRAIGCATEASYQAAKADTNAIVSTDYAAVVSHPEVEAVDIVVPNYLHEEIACAALNAGKHVLLEKPMSVSVESCDRIIEAAKKSGKLLLIGHEMRFSSMYARIHQLIKSGRLGEPRYVMFDLWRRPYRPGSSGWRLDPKRVGNWTLEEPVHFFDAAGWYLSSAGEPVSVYAYGNRNDSSLTYDADISDNFTAIFSYPNRAYAMISQTLAAVEHHCSIKVFGSEALVRAEWHAELDRSEHPSFSLEVSNNGKMEGETLSSTPGELFELREEIAAFAGAIRNGDPLPISPEEGRRAVMLCVEARRSLESGEALSLMEAVPA